MADHARRAETGVTRDQMMARHKANHNQVVYSTSAAEADRAVRVRAALAQELGSLSICAEYDEIKVMKHVRRITGIKVCAGQSEYSNRRSYLSFSQRFLKVLLTCEN